VPLQTPGALVSGRAELPAGQPLSVDTRSPQFHFTFQLATTTASVNYNAFSTHPSRFLRNAPQIALRTCPMTRTLAVLRRSIRDESGRHDKLTSMSFSRRCADVLPALPVMNGFNAAQ